MNRLLLFTFFSILSNDAFTQAGKVFDAQYVQQAPFSIMGTDSLKQYYLNHFLGFDSLKSKATRNGDVEKYLRIYFTFIVDPDGFISEPHFQRIASTRYDKSYSAKTIEYFLTDDETYEKAIKLMLKKMPAWKPALQYGVPVSCKVTDYLQVWNGTEMKIR